MYKFLSVVSCNLIMLLTKHINIDLIT